MHIRNNTIYLTLKEAGIGSLGLNERVIALEPMDID